MYSLTNRIEKFLASLGSMPIYSSFLQTAKKYGMINALSGDLAVGFSGGPDSVMLLLLLVKYRHNNGLGNHILAVHVNHSIRKGTADNDETFSREFCDAIGVEFCVRKVDVPAFAKENGLGIEEAARSVRYSVFREVITGREDVNSVFLAHNATDNVETVILNMLRGSGVKGMRGIPPARDSFYRPMLTVEKSDILTTLDSYSIPYAIDETNSTDEYTRNYVRHNVLPNLSNINPSYATAIARLTDNMREAYSLVESLSTPILDAIRNAENFPVKHLRGLHSTVFADVMSKLAYSRLGVYPDEIQIKAIESQIAKDNFSVSLSRADFVCQRGICFFDSRDKKSSTDVIFELQIGENKIQGTNATVLLEISPDFIEFSPDIYNYSIYADFDGDIIDKGVYLRFRRDGDSYRYGGITRRLKKVFNDLDVPPFVRGNVPVICDSNGILWVPGLGVRDDAKPKEKDKTLRITVLLDSSDGKQIYSARNFKDKNI